MNKTTNFRYKAVISSIFVVAIMCLAATAVPMTNGSQTNQIINNFYENDEIIKRETFEKAIANFGNNPLGRKLLNQTKFDLTYEEFIKFYNSIDLSKVSFENFINLLRTKLNPLHQQQVIFSNEFEKVNKIIEKNASINYLTHSNNELINLDPSDDFLEYWDYYCTSVEHWKFSSSENWQSWFNSMESYSKIIAVFSIFIVFLSLVLCLVHQYWTTIIGWGSLAAVSIIGLYFLFYIIDGFTYYSNSIEDQVEILLHVINKNTKEGIDGLWTDKGIEARNINAIEKCDGTRGKHEEYFTYYVGPALGTNKSGWYALGNREIAENNQKDLKAPHPPGDWEIEINDENDIYKNKIVPIEDIPRNGTVVIEIELTPR